MKLSKMDLNCSKETHKKLEQNRNLDVETARKVLETDLIRNNFLVKEDNIKVFEESKFFVEDC